MKIQQRCWMRGAWDPKDGWSLGRSAQLVLAFGTGQILSNTQLMDEIRKAHPAAQVVGCSTAGEIFGNCVNDDSLVVTAMAFQQTQVQVAQTNFGESSNSFAAGQMLASELAAEDLVHVLVLSDGLNVNGSELVKGLSAKLTAKVAVTGGLSGDGSKFQRTLTYCNGALGDRVVVAVGLYGSHLRAGYGSLGGWDPFGPERIVTRSAGNVLYELDGESALALYKRYLGPYAADLPASGLRFPLSIRASLSETPVVRTILAIDENQQSMTFAGDIPQGSYSRLMRCSFDRLVNGATTAATRSQEALGSDSAELAILISCVGRKLIMQQRTEEEVDAVRAVLGKDAVLTGFYSYGEISPFHASAKCELHNQTMTVTVLCEAA
ncbi:MAG: FIST N-terminal domain-containing protein [Tepidisphaeraceae bacterium]